MFFHSQTLHIVRILKLTLSHDVNMALVNDTHTIYSPALTVTNAPITIGFHAYHGEQTTIPFVFLKIFFPVVYDST